MVRTGGPGSSGTHPFIVVLAGADPGLIHHMAEIALLRDLGRAGSATSG
ncbi:hypothetical protein [Streptomyces sp. NBC_00111]